MKSYYHDEIKEGEEGRACSSYEKIHITKFYLENLTRNPGINQKLLKK
jgi:hypothetical protein